MLVLSRKVSESIKIGDGITIVVNRIAGNRVTLGVEAPRNMRIIRGELRPFEQPAKEDQASDKAPADCREAQPSTSTTSAPPAIVPGPNIRSEPPLCVRIDSSLASYFPRRAR